jgi:DNA mismatch endonuclease (patch repair protein)
MRAITSRGNRTTENRLRALLVRAGFSGWTMHPQNAPGSPDFIFLKERVAIFTDGCFWHGCPTCGHIPKTNKRYWKAKIARNQLRDKISLQQARALGYGVIRIWECHLKENARGCIGRVRRAVLSSKARAFR